MILRGSIRRVLATAIRTVEVGGGRRIRAAVWPIVTHIDPEPAGLGPSQPWRQHRNRRVPAVNLPGRKNVPPDPCDGRREQPPPLSHPIPPARPVDARPPP